MKKMCIAALLAVVVTLPLFAGFAQINATTRWLQGKQAFLDGNYSQAIAIWTEENVVKYDLSDSGYYFWLANAYTRTGANDKAVETARKGLALGPGDPNVVGNLQWVLAMAYSGLNQYDAALAAAQSAIAVQPQDEGNYRLLCQIYNAMGRYDDALTAGKRALELKPTPAAYSLLASCSFNKGDLNGALEALRKGLALAPQDGNMLMGVGRVNVEKMDFKAAAEAYQRALDAKQPDAGFWIAFCDYCAGDYDQALARAKAGVAGTENGRIGITLTLNAQNAIAVQSVVPGGPADEAGIKPEDMIWEIDGKRTTKGAFHIEPVMTMDEVTKAISGQPGTTVKLKIYRPSKVLPIERVVTRKALANKDAAPLYGVASLASRSKGDFDQALDLAQKAVSLDPAILFSQFPYGLALYEKGRYDDALSALTKTGTTTTVLFMTYHDRLASALCYAKKGDLAKASEIYLELAEKLNPNDVPCWKDREALLALLAPSIQGHLEAAKKLEAEGKYADALPEYGQALKFAASDKEAAALRAAMFTDASKMPTPPELPEEARVHVVRGEALIKDGDLPSAVKEFNEAIRLAPYMPKLYYNAALLNGQIKNYAEAMRLMNIYLQGAPDAPDARAAKDEIIRWQLEMERQGKK